MTRSTVDRSSSAAGDAPLRTGVRVADKYALVSKLGEGAQGQVWSAEYDGRTFAVKVLNQVSASLGQEIDALKRISHPNVVSLVDHTEWQGHQVLVMPLAKMTLRDWIRDAHDPELVMGFVKQICDGLGAIHHSGLVHRDLKPSNILLFEAGDVLQLRVADLGVARNQGKDSVRHSLMTIGTEPYLAPEQKTPTYGSVMPSTDVFALAVVVLEMLSGREPRCGHDRHALWDVARDRKQMPIAVGELLPKEFHHLVEPMCRALDPFSNQRIASPGRFWEDLRSATHHQLMPPEPEDGGSGAWANRGPERRSGLYRVGVALLGLLVVVGAAIAAQYGVSQPPVPNEVMRVAPSPSVAVALPLDSRTVPAEAGHSSGALPKKLRPSGNATRAVPRPTPIRSEAYDAVDEPRIKKARIRISTCLHKVSNRRLDLSGKTAKGTVSIFINNEGRATARIEGEVQPDAREVRECFSEGVLTIQGMVFEPDHGGGRSRKMNYRGFVGLREH